MKKTLLTLLLTTALANTLYADAPKNYKFENEGDNVNIYRTLPDGEKELIDTYLKKSIRDITIKHNSSYQELDMRSSSKTIPLKENPDDNKVYITVEHKNGIRSSLNLSKREAMKPQKPATFEAVPPELLKGIIGKNIAPEDFDALSKVSKHFKSAMESPSLEAEITLTQNKFDEILNALNNGKKITPRTNVQELEISSVFVNTNSDLTKILKLFPNITSLKIKTIRYAPSISVNDNFLKEVPKLTHLMMDDVNIDFFAIKDLKNLKNLRILNTYLNTKNRKIISSITQLEDLDLSYSVAMSFGFLKNFTKLRIFRLEKKYNIPGFANNLKKNLPENCEIIFTDYQF